MFYTPESEINSRIAALQNLMNGNLMEGALILQSSDMFYYSGVFQNGALYIPSRGNPLLFIRKNYRRAAEASSLDNVIQIKNIKQIPQLLNERGYTLPGVLGLELDVITAQMYIDINKIFENSRLVDCSGLIRKQRAVKSDYEIELIKKASALTDDFFQELPGIIAPGKKECEIAGALESAARRRGHQGAVRVRGFNNEFHYGCLLSGENGGIASHFDGPLGGPGLNPSFPFGSGRRVICINEPVMVDYVGAFDGYCVDMSRVFVAGCLAEKLERAHRTAVDIQNSLAEQAKPGVTGEELYESALAMAVKAGLSDNFMGFGQQVSFVGHGVGIELNELPVLARGVKTPLEAGMVIALEPKFIFPGEGAVGIENTFVVTSPGLERLSSHPDGIGYLSY
ncbi:Xaa-Pro aminopeptidase [Desulfocucumis palustris]|uniref:Xaa-Pro aminopeptidase n=1 Tax=Desulfocucumis palustris TaxID=1898651 RepID=A0A2L2XCV7_9FIRM|nr:Xaa-Pro peptidase family protein [Desulfocucumis palustris]GBF34078.1 Xaa-Pro aminopeptidase [Desulfocucumis palustris]